MTYTPDPESPNLPKPEEFPLVSRAMAELTGFPPRMITWKSMNHYEAETLQVPGANRFRRHYTWLILNGEAVRQN